MKRKLTVELEPLLFGEYGVGVYDETLNLILGKKYYFPCFTSAAIGADTVTKKFISDGYEVEFVSHKE